MSTRRARTSASKKRQTSKPAPAFVTGASASAGAPAGVISVQPHPSETTDTAQLRALEAGWDELLV